jgi:hypothetical protein
MLGSAAPGTTGTIAVPSWSSLTTAASEREVHGVLQNQRKRKKGPTHAHAHAHARTYTHSYSPMCSNRSRSAESTGASPLPPPPVAVVGCAWAIIAPTRGSIRCRPSPAAAPVAGGGAATVGGAGAAFSRQDMAEASWLQSRTDKQPRGGTVIRNQRTNGPGGEQLPTTDSHSKCGREIHTANACRHDSNFQCHCAATLKLWESQQRLHNDEHLRWLSHGQPRRRVSALQEEGDGHGAMLAIELVKMLQKRANVARTHRGGRP